jgi:hypothetical protein
LWQPEDDGGSDADGGHEGVCASVVAGVDTAPVFELSEHVLDEVALPVEHRIVRDMDLAVGLGRDAGDGFAGGERLAEPVCVIALVRDHRLGPGQAVEQQGRPFVVTHLAFGDQHHQKAAVAVADGVQLIVQAAFGAPDTSGNSPFLSRLAAVRCAFRCVASIISVSGLPLLAASSAKMRLNTPNRLQR